MTKDEFGLRLSKDCAVAPGAHVLAAVSGGADSMALLCFLLEIRDAYPLRVSAAHVEHGIRGADSLEDLAFVRAFCERNGVKCFSAQVDAPAYAKAHGCGLEDAARTLRYAFLQETADAIGADVIALAHHAQDQAETVLLHAVRGCDVQGLGAMRKRSGRLIRPLLDCPADTLRDFLRQTERTWREDATNEDTAYARNRIRRCVTPQLERINPGACAALCRLAQAAQRDEDYFDMQLDALHLPFIALLDGAAIRRDAIAALHPALLSRVLVRMVCRAGLPAQDAEAIGRIMQALEQPAETAAINLRGGGIARVGRAHLCMNAPNAIRIDAPVTLPDAANQTAVTHTPLGILTLRYAQPGETGDGITTQAIPADLLAGARITNRREGDTMIPFGKRSPVKLKKLLIDALIEQGMKNSMPVLRTREGEILWAVGLRASQRCMGEETKIIAAMHAPWTGGEAAQEECRRKKP